MLNGATAIPLPSDGFSRFLLPVLHVDRALSRILKVFREFGLPAIRSDNGRHRPRSHTAQRLVDPRIRPDHRWSEWRHQ